MSGHVEGEWRCEVCRHGRHISAWAPANIHGWLEPDGLVRPDEVEQHGENDVYESSVQCDRHPDAELRRWFGGRWRRWTTCPECEGSGEGEIDPNRSTFQQTVRRPCKACKGDGGHWFLRQQAVPALVGAASSPQTNQQVGGEEGG